MATVRRGTPGDAGAVARLAVALWPEHREEELLEEFRGYLRDPECAVMLAEEDGAAVGFAQCQLRHDYVEGTDSSPVGYLEGLYVAPPYRERGLGRWLVEACQDWAGGMGCSEFASDCELDNRDSLAFHLKCGFSEANRIICFTKSLGPREHG